MKFRNIWIVFRKEFLDVLRDRRTLFSMILLPIAIFPLLTVGLGGFVAQQYEKLEERVSPLVVLNPERSPGLVQALQEDGGLQVITSIPDSTAAFEMLADDAVQAVLLMTDSTRAGGMQPESFNQVIIWYNGSQHESEAVMRKARSVAREYREAVIRSSLLERGLSEDLLKPFAVSQENRASQSQMAGVLLGMMLPYMIILLTMVGSTYIAIDLTAGEKERGTMETLLVSPATRLELVLGKFLTTMLAGTITAMLGVISMSVSIFAPGSLAGKGMEGEAFSLDPMAFGLVFVLFIPIAALFASALIAIAVNARSYKEAQSYIYPLMIAIIFPALASMMPGIENNVKMAMIPLMNVSLVLRDAFIGQYDTSAIFVTIISSFVYAIIAIFIAMRVFQKESVLLRT